MKLQPQGSYRHIILCRFLLQSAKSRSAPLVTTNDYLNYNHISPTDRFVYFPISNAKNLSGVATMKLSLCSYCLSRLWRKRKVIFAVL